MKYFRSRWLLLLLAAAAASAKLPDWIAYIEAGNRLEAVFFRPMTLPGGPVSARRPPKETRTELTSLISATPSDADLYSLRAREEEVLLDTSAAEADWKKFAELAADKAEGSIALADFYHRQLRVPQELQALGAAAGQPSPPTERFTAPQQQRSWKLFQRMLELARRQLLARDVTDSIYKQWRERYPKESEPLRAWIQFAIAQKQYSQAETLAQEFAKQFPYDLSVAIRARADVAKSRAGVASALAVYDREFRPLWPQDLITAYFQALREARQSRTFLTSARSLAAASPLALDPAARIFHYYNQEGNTGAAVRALNDYVRRKEAVANSWKPDELETVARLWDSVQDINSASRFWFALYSQPGTPATQQEEALASLIGYLLSAPDRLSYLGAGSLKLYQDLATSDPGPGYLNGILSLLLNSAEPQWRFNAQENAADPYFRRARGAELIDLFERRFPSSTRRSQLRAQLLQSFATHGDSDAVIRAGQQFLTSFPSDGLRVQVSLLIADAHARKNQVKEELALYDALLAELAKRAEGVPLGEGIVVRGPGSAGPAGPRSPEYARVLDRYISRLAAMKRPKDALLVLRRELDRNPDDPGIYERLAQFLDQNKLAAEIEAVYKRAMERFPDRTWHHKLARFYLRQRQIAAFRTLTADVTRIFSGTELQKYFVEIVSGPANLDSQLLRQVNLAAHQRFPRNLSFVRNLLNIYQRRETANAVEWERLIRNYWFYEADLRGRFFEFLQRTGKLRAEVQALRASNQAANPAAQQMLAEAEAWRAHYEDAYAPLNALAKDIPGETSLGFRAASLARSLSAYEARRTVDAVGFETSLAKATPRDSAVLTRIGELYADSDRFSLARPHWQRIADIAPGDGEGYLESATVFWDYFQYDDALRMIENGRRKLASPSLHAYEAGAIYENKRDYNRAVDEYLKGALAQPGGSLAHTRLLELARRPSLRPAIDAATTRQLNLDAPDLAAVSLRIALLEEQQRKGDLEAFLLNLADRAQSFEILTRIEEEGRRLAMANVEERSLLRQVSMTQDPVDKIRQRLVLVSHYENQQNLPAAARVLDALVRENPQTLGVVRAAVNYYWRNRNVSRTLELLNNAATVAHPERRVQLQLEAARKATEGAQYAAARTILQELLRSKPEDPVYISAMADTYARERDDRALRAYYQERITALPRERVAQIAQLRRSLIPVLTRTKDFAAAVDQYMEILNRYPEDTSLADEVAGYARRYGQQQRLTSFYQKTSAASPRDARFHALLARLFIAFEDYPSAIAAFTKASELRPDRIDLLAARGDLEERLLRFDEAAATFSKVYDLSYRSSVWMERVAQVRARQRRTEECLAALRKAYIEGREDSPAGYFTAADKLETWGMLSQARENLDKGMQLAGEKIQQEHSYAIPIYARVMSRLGQFDAAYTKVPTPEMLSWLARYAGQFATPAQKTQFAALLDRLGAVAPPSLGQAAGMPDWEVKRLVQTLMAQPGGEEANSALERLRQLQRSRLAFADLGQQMEAYWKVHPVNDGRPQLLEYAIEAYRTAGDEAAELRLHGLSGVNTERHLELLAKRVPARLVQLAGRGPRDAAANAALASGNATLAMQAIAARATGQPPVWQRAYTGLTGLYFGLRTPNINQAFQEALGSMLIGDRLGKPVDRSQQLAGSNWYAYGSRYTEYLDLLKNQQASDFLAAAVEASPGNADSYYTLAEYERESGRASAAMQDYGYALQLQPRHAASMVRRGTLFAAQNNMTAARSSWKEALDALSAQLEDRRPPYSAVADLNLAMEELVPRKLHVELRADVERTVLAALRRFGPQSLRNVLKHFDAPWLVAASRSLPAPGEFLGSLVDEPWLSPQAKTLLLEKAVEAYQSQAAGAVGEVRDTALAQYYNTLGRYLEYLIDRGDVERARVTAATLPLDGRQRLDWVLEALDVYVAERAGSLPQRIQAWQSGEETAPSEAVVRRAAITLRDKGSVVASRQLLRFLYERQLQQTTPRPSEFLGLAEVLLEEGDTSGAVSQLRRMSLVTEPAFVNLPAAAALLRRFQKETEAREFADMASKAMPWLTGPADRAAPVATLAQAVAEVRANPDDPDRKMQLFRLAHAAGQHRLALNAMAPLSGYAYRSWFEGDVREDLEPNRYAMQQFLEERQLSLSERARLARDVSDSFDRTQMLSSAIAMRLVAQALQSAPADASWIADRRRELARRKTNLDRLPFVSENLEQPRVVRPMIGPAAAGGAR